MCVLALKVIWVQGKHQCVQGGGTPAPGLRKVWLIHANSCIVIFCHCSYDCRCWVCLTWFFTECSFSFTGLFTFSIFLFELCSGGRLTDDWSLQVCIWLALLNHSSFRMALLQLPPLLQPESRNMTGHYWHQNETWAQKTRHCSVGQRMFTLKLPGSIPATQSLPLSLTLSHLQMTRKPFTVLKNVLSECVGTSVQMKGRLWSAWSEAREKAS